MLVWGSSTKLSADTPVAAVGSDPASSSGSMHQPASSGAGATLSPSGGSSTSGADVTPSVAPCVAAHADLSEGEQQQLPQYEVQLSPGSGVSAQESGADAAPAVPSDASSSEDGSAPVNQNQTMRHVT